MRRNWLETPAVWVGRNPHKSLGIFAFNGYAAALSEAYYPVLCYTAPARISGPKDVNLLAVWAQKRQ